MARNDGWPFIDEDFDANNTDSDSDMDALLTRAAALGVPSCTGATCAGACQHAYHYGKLRHL
eukprot:4672211-Amphidinium_carterae.1